MHNAFIKFARIRDIMGEDRFGSRNCLRELICNVFKFIFSYKYFKIYRFIYSLSILDMFKKNL